MSAASLLANLTVLDSIAYIKWHKAEHATLSENSQWVMYQYHYINNDAKNLENRNRFFIWNNRNEQTLTMDSIANPVFLAESDWIAYTECRNSLKDKTFFLNLRSGKRLPWTQKGSPKYEHNVPIVSFKEKKSIDWIDWETVQSGKSSSVNPEGSGKRNWLRWILRSVFNCGAGTILSSNPNRPSGAFRKNDGSPTDISIR